MKALAFEIETVYLANFRKPLSTITILSFPFPPFTTVRGLIANALGKWLWSNRDDYNEDLKNIGISIKPLNIPVKIQDMVLMKKLKSNLKSGSKKPNENTVMTKLREKKTEKLTDGEKTIYEKLKKPRSTSAPFVKEYISPFKCRIFLKGGNDEIEEISSSLKNPKRPLYLGASDDFVVLSNVLIHNTLENVCSARINSTVKINRNIYPLNKKLIVGRIPFCFIKNGKNKKGKQNYSREDIIIAAPDETGFVELNKKIKCFRIGEDYVSF